MTHKLILPLASSLVLLASIPALAASHGHAPNGDKHGKPSHTVVLPSQAATTAQSAVNGNVPIGNGQNQAKDSTKVSATSGSKHDQQGSPHSGQPGSVKAAVAEIHVLRTEIQGARLKYVASIKMYIQSLSATLASGKTGSLETALSQLKKINSTLAQTVQSEMKAKGASTAGADAKGLTKVTAKFKAELAALQAATKEVQGLTTTLNGTSTSTTSTSSSISTSGSSSTTGS